MENEDDLQIEQAADWPQATAEQKADLTSSLKSCFHAWLQRHNLQPDFWVVDDVQIHTVNAGE